MERDYLPVIDFWFRELTPAQWFGESGPAVDVLVQERLGKLLAEAQSGTLDAWAESPRGRLALIVLLDQVPRNVFRGRPESFAGDSKAQRLARDGVALGMDRTLTFAERHFFYMPLMHAEDRELQALSVAKYRELADEAAGILAFAEGHRAAIERFGRFPHRNVLLDRSSTPAELEFLESKGNELAGGGR